MPRRLSGQRDPALADAIFRTGSSRKLADALGLTHQAITHWQRVPAKYVVEVEKASGIARQVLRPDLYDGATKDQLAAMDLLIAKNATARAIRSAIRIHEKSARELREVLEVLRKGITNGGIDED